MFHLSDFGGALYISVSRKNYFVGRKVDKTAIGNMIKN